ncbi:hypothetical protein ACQPXH_04020 [Nocardia sp. CA-135953]|uniref:hypothetical protein n=1 Tax=Nocardia sp. CA-135953 TaxID=3239978 RepID=UPI003D9956C8
MIMPNLEPPQRISEDLHVPGPWPPLRQATTTTSKMLGVPMTARVTDDVPNLRPTDKPNKPKAIGLVRNDVSGPHSPRHALDVQRHANTLGYQYVYTLRPPADIDDSITYTLAIVAGLEVQAIVVFDLGHVDCQPALICDAGFDLETVCPQGTWTRSAQPMPGVETGAA